MIGPVAPGGAFDAFAEAFAPGLVGQISVSIYDQNDNILFGPSTDGITEIAAIGDLARYGVTLYAPEAQDTYLVVWDDNQPDPNSASEELRVTTQTDVGTPVEWITGADVAECCAGTDVGSDTSPFDAAAAAANDLLYELSGRQFPGVVGPVVVRPYGGRCGGSYWNSIVWSSTPLYWGGNAWAWQGRGGRAGCGCPPVPSVRLAGSPVREIVAVKIDGAFLTADQYRLDESNLLVRMRDPATPRRGVCWPSCQILNLPDNQPGTFSVRYTWGQNPPAAAVDAAKELACQIYKSCAGDEDCALPSGVTRVQRQGVTVERAILAEAIRKGQVNLPMTDLFLGTFNPKQASRQSAVWSPDTGPWPWRPGV